MTGDAPGAKIDSAIHRLLSLAKFTYLTDAACLKVRRVVVTPT